MPRNLSKKIFKEALKNLKSPVDEEGHFLPLVVKVPLAREMEHKNWLKRMIAFVKQMASML